MINHKKQYIQIVMEMIQKEEKNHHINLNLHILNIYLQEIIDFIFVNQWLIVLLSFTNFLIIIFNWNTLSFLKAN